MMSPSSTNAIGPPSAASGEICPIEIPRDAPEKRPSVIKPTLAPSHVQQFAMLEQAFQAFLVRLLDLHSE